LEATGVTCYFRHLKDVFKKAGIVVTNENKREIDRVIHGIVGVEYKNCPDTWTEVKKRLADDEEGFVSELKQALVNRI
jgi:molecular chaperone GrpE (heat shock protein)